MYEIKTYVVNTLTNEVNKPNQYNTFWRDGELCGIQDYLKVKYEIILHPDYED